MMDNLMLELLESALFAGEVESQFPEHKAEIKKDCIIVTITDEHTYSEIKNKKYKVTIEELENCDG